jgi:hypothetical protein
MTSAANVTLNLPVRTLIAVCLSGWSLSWLVGSERFGQREIPQVSEASFFAATGVWVVGDEGLPLLWQREGFVSQLGVSASSVASMMSSSVAASLLCWSCCCGCGSCWWRAGGTGCRSRGCARLGPAFGRRRLRRHSQPALVATQRDPRGQVAA